MTTIKNIDNESVMRAIDMREELIKEKAEAEANLDGLRDEWANAAAEGNRPWEEAITEKIHEVRVLIDEVDFKIKALDNLRITSDQTLIQYVTENAENLKKMEKDMLAREAMAKREAEAAREKRILDRERDLLNNEAHLTISNGRIINGVLTVEGVTFSRNDNKGFTVPEWRDNGGRLLHDFLKENMPLTDADYREGGFSPTGDSY